MQLSIVVPLYNEAEVVTRLYEAIRDAMESACQEFEAIFVDDGSDDGTLPILESLAAADPRLSVLCLRRNFGQTAAMRAGIEHAEGKIIVTMDGDLQNDPRDIPALLEKLEEGYDLVTGWRQDRKDRFVSRKIPSKVANWIIAKVSDVPIHDTGCSLKAYRAELIRRVPLYSELHRFIPAISAMAGARVAEVVVRHHPRRYGKSKYGLSRIGRVLLDVLLIKMLISFSQRPLHWFGLWSLPCFAFSVVAGVYAISSSWVDDDTPSIVFPAVAFLLAYLALNLLVTGMLGELIVRAEPSRRVEPLATHTDIVPKTRK